MIIFLSGDVNSTKSSSMKKNDLKHEKNDVGK